MAAHLSLQKYRSLIFCHRGFVGYLQVAPASFPPRLNMIAVNGRTFSQMLHKSCQKVGQKPKVEFGDELTVMEKRAELACSTSLSRACGGRSFLEM